MGKTKDAPEISMKQAMRLFIISGRGTISTVEKCPAAAFIRQVTMAIETTHRKKQGALIRELLEDSRLDYSTDEAKYYAIVRLQESGAAQFIYTSLVDDRDSRTKANSLLS